MKKHLLSLFTPSNRRWTAGLLTVAILLIAGAMLEGITDNLRGIAMLIVGMIFLFFSVFHTWRKVENYAILIGVCVGIIALVFLVIYILSLLHKSQYISEGVVMSIIFLFCVPGILTGILGAFFCSFRSK